MSDSRRPLLSGVGAVTYQSLAALSEAMYPEGTRVVVDLRELHHTIAGVYRGACVAPEIEGTVRVRLDEPVRVLPGREVPFINALPMYVRLECDVEVAP